MASSFSALLLGFCAKRNPKTSGKQHVILLIAKYGLAIVTIIEKKISRHPPVQLRCDTKVSGDPILAVVVQRGEVIKVLHNIGTGAELM
jgi:hypothetical protein